MKIRLDEMTWPELRSILEGKNLILLPLGSTEEHGTHLPLDVDSVCATQIAEKAAAKAMAGLEARVLVAPTIHYTDVAVHKMFPGSVGVRAETMVLVLKDVVGAFLAQGFRRIVLFSGHHENNGPMEMALRTLADSDPQAKLLAVTSMGLGFDVRPGLVKAGNAGQGHGLEIETSLSLLLQPQNVCLEKAQKGSRRLPLGERFIGPTGSDRTKGVIYYSGTAGFETTGIYGDPTMASREEGERIFQAIVDDLAEIILEVLE